MALTSSMDRALRNCLAAWAVFALAVGGWASQAQEPPRDQPPAEAVPADEPLVVPDVKFTKERPLGRLVHVPLPIAGNADVQVKRAIRKALAEIQPGAGRPVLVLEFSSAQKQTGQGSDFGRAQGLARYLTSRELSAVRTVAYIPHELKGHAVLVAMACEEIAMASDARIGAAGIDEPGEEPLNPTVLADYQQTANRRRTIPPALASAMLDKSVELLMVETEISREFVTSADLPELQKRHTIKSEKILSRPGRWAEFTGAEARHELGFVTCLASDRASLARALSLPANSLEDDPSLLGEWRPIRVPLHGRVNGQVVSRVQRTIEDKIRNEDVNFICLSIDSPGGSLADSMNLANFLAELDRSKIRTVAYVESQARSDAALVALACDQLVMGRDAVLGGAGDADLTQDEIDAALQSLRTNVFAKKQRSWSLPAATIDPQLAVYQYTHKRDGLVDYFCAEELESQADPAVWDRGALVSNKGEPLKVSGEQAKALDLARLVAPSLTALREHYGIENDLAISAPGWADMLIDALSEPKIAWLLLLIGGAALYAELQAPGIGVGGFIAGLCFLLFFWSHYLDGTADWLEVLLFLGGVCCILLEVFVMPGVAVFGLGGGLMVLASLVLASQTFVLPHNEYQLLELRDSLLGLFAAGAGVVGLAMVMRKYLPHAPFFNHVMLEPPSDSELEDLEQRESLVAWGHLVGQVGHATTQLTPSGKALFENELVDVIADGEAIDRGSRVVVVDVQGNRVLVRSAT